MRAPSHRVDQRCDLCGQFDRHPRHVHAGDDGSVTYRHMDCCDHAGCFDDTGICGTVLRASRARGEQLVTWLESRMGQLEGELTAWLRAGAPIMGGASGMDANRVTDFLGVVVGYSAPAAGTAVLTSGFNSGASSLGHIRLMTTNGSSTVNGTQLSGGSYVTNTGITYATGTSGAFSAPAYSAGSGTVQTNTSLSQAGMPAATVAGIEIWDSAGTPLRWLWGALASAITTNNGDTLSFGSGAVLATLVA
jgi:hypothetical protein